MVHPKVLEVYKENDFDYYKTASDYNEEAFYEQANGAKAPIKKEITKVVRLKDGKQEYFYYHVELKSTNFLGNKIHHYTVVGKYELPEFRRDVDTKTNKARVLEIESFTPVYELKWDSDWKGELDELVGDKTDFVIVTPSRKYGGFSFDDFRELEFDKLVTLGKFGTLEPARIEEIKKKTGRSK